MAAPTQAILTTFNKNTIITFYRRKITTLTIIMYIISEKKILVQLQLFHEVFFYF